MVPPAPPAPRVLVVDDDELGRRTVARVLRPGCRVTCTDAAGALALLAEGDFDVAVIGNTVPDELRLARWRRHVEAIVALHPGAASGDIFAMLTDPTDVDQLRQCVRRAAAHSRQRRAAEDESRVGPEGVLRRALDSLFSTYDPLVRAEDSTVYGYEAIAHSNEPTCPDGAALFDAAERLGKLQPVMSRVLALAEEDLATPAPAAMVLVRAPHAIARDPPQPPSGLESRVIVSLQLGQASRNDLRDGVRALHHAGYHVAVEDFGPSYPGITSFVDIGPDIVRIDGDLIRGIDASASKRSVVAAITRLCRHTGVLVLASGVRNARERAALVRAGCDLLQGRFLASP